VTASLLAHQGGWDELLFVALPIVIFAGLLVVANRRAARIEDHVRRQREAEPPATPGDQPGGPAPG